MCICMYTKYSHVIYTYLLLSAATIQRLQFLSLIYQGTIQRYFLSYTYGKYSSRSKGEKNYYVPGVIIDTNISLKPNNNLNNTRKCSYLHIRKQTKRLNTLSIAHNWQVEKLDSTTYQTPCRDKQLEQGEADKNLLIRITYNAITCRTKENNKVTYLVYLCECKSVS